jgi:5S rRNA maturation endonuclease (ribonuclease M5)
MFEQAARERFGEPNRRLSTTKEMRFGTHGSVSVNVETGDYYDFEAEQGGKLAEMEVVPAPNAPRLIVRKYDYIAESGELAYQVVRYMPKTFRQRRPDGAGGWLWNLDDVRLVPYRLPDLRSATDVVIVEGEKDADALAAVGICATTKPMGSGSWPDELTPYFEGKRVWVVPDNDDVGRKTAERTAAALSAVAASVTVADLCAGMRPKADVSDWLAVNDADMLMPALRSFEPRLRVVASGFSANDMRAVEPRQWLYGKHLIRGYVSATVSPGGVGKTTLELIEAIALATARPLLGVPVRERVRVWHYNLEDPRDELMRRVWAICEHYSIPPVELEGWLFLDSGRDCKMIVAEPQDGVVVPTVAAEQVIEQMQRWDISVLQVDPLVKAHYAEENDNKQIDAVLDVFADIAKRCGAAIDLVHHTRKPPSGFVATAGDINTARGAGALAGAVRSARTITPMSEKESEAFGILPARRGWYIRVDDAKGNMSAPSSDAVWCERHTVELAQGDYVGVLAPWSPPDPFDELGAVAGQEVLSYIQLGLDDGQRFILANKRGTTRWAGELLLEKGVSEAATKYILRTWIQSGLLYEETYRNPERRKDEVGLFVDMTKIPTSYEVVSE